MTTKNIQKVIENQRNELSELKSKKYLPRQIDSKISTLLPQPLIKVVLGPRRSGKSSFCVKMIEDLDCAYANFDNEVLSDKALHVDILEALNSVYGNTEYYFFDEIQNLDKWEYLVNELHRNGKNVIVTGSNSRLLSRELSTALTGRHVPIHIYPFSYEEYLTVHNKRRDSGTLDAYIKTGGFPELILNANLSNYLNTLLDSLILRDIVDRYKVRNVVDLQSLADFILASPALPVTMRSLQKVLGIKSLQSIKKYLAYIEEVFAIIKVTRFSRKIKEGIKSYSKIYPIDTGYIEAKKKTITKDRGKIYEAFVAIELYKRAAQQGLELFYYKTKNNKEIDFVLKKNSEIVEVIQVCSSLERTNFKRELSSLQEAGRELECTKLICFYLDADDEYIEKFSEVTFKKMWEV